jgi:hypothetical protein
MRRQGRPGSIFVCADKAKAGLSGKREKQMGKPVFQENVVIITGASLGIGRELAFQLAGQGAWLALASRTP